MRSNKRPVLDSATEVVGQYGGTTNRLIFRRLRLQGVELLIETLNISQPHYSTDRL